MDSVASRIIKARQYAAEKDQRVHVRVLEVEIQGDNADHTVTYDRTEWNCDCEEFALRGICAHVMAMEEILGDAVAPVWLPAR
jgi:hypothetical protein